MRILAITNLYPNPFQPHRATYNRHQFRMLAELHDVRVIAPVLWTDEWAARRKSLPALPPGRRVVHDGLTVDHPRYWYTPKIFRRYYGDFFLASIRRTVDTVLSEFRPDLLFAPWAYPDGYAAVQLGREIGLPVVVQVHGSDLREMSQFKARTSGTAAAVAGADGVICVSQDLAERATGLGAQPHRVRVVIDGVDHKVFCPGDRELAQARLKLSANLKHMLFVGNLVRVKGLDVLLDACRRLPASLGGWNLHVIGDGPLRTELENQVKSYGLALNVQFHGSRPHADLPNWFRAANLFVLASRSEGVPNVLLEASACGLPFVASAVGGIPEIAGRGSRLVPPENPDALAGAVAEMLAAPPQQIDGPRDRREAVAEMAAFFESVVVEREAKRAASAPVC